MILRLHPEARKELRQIAEWYEDRREGLGPEVRDEVSRALNAVLEQPLRWPLSSIPKARALGIRHFVVERFPLVIEYIGDEKRVLVFAVAHSSRRPGYWLRRLVRKR